MGKNKKKRKLSVVQATQKSSAQESPSQPKKTEHQDEKIERSGEIKKQKKLEKDSKKEEEKVEGKIDSHYGFFDCRDQFQGQDVPLGKSILESTLETSKKAAKFFEWMIAPVSIEEFYERFWEKRMLIIKRGCPHYYDGWFSKSEINELLEKKQLKYGVNLDITIYENGERKTLNPEGVAKAEEVWKFFEQGCSVRLLHPQQFSDSLWKMLATLEEFWGWGGGCNSYLTPAGSQGFAPHYDDVEAFVVQLEGRKKWKLYAPKQEKDILPRFSSPNFSQDQIGEPDLEVEIEPGDLVYFPRGFTHQAISVPNQHSLHITVSTALKNTWYDYMQLAIPRALELAFEESQELRESLPRDYLSYLGVIHSDKDDDRRDEFMMKVLKLLEKVVRYTPFDSVADRMGSLFAQQRLPLPSCLAPPPEKNRKKMALTLATKIKLTTATAARLVIEDEFACIYSPMLNQRAKHALVKANTTTQEEAPCIEFPLDFAGGLDYLINKYPESITIDSIPMQSEEDRLEIAKSLLEYGIITITK